MSRKGLVWFKCGDLRLRDHRPLVAAHRDCSAVGHVYIFDPAHFQRNLIGEPSISRRRLLFQCECLLDLQVQLQTVGCALHVVVGDSADVVHRLVEDLSVDALYLHDEKMVNETKLLGRIQQRIGGERVVAVYDAGGLVPLDRLPFPLAKLDSYSMFRKQLFRRWQRGQTGYPFVDASMRELLVTGYMSNRGRQNVASFLVNDLRVDWRWGASHFERHLVDYDVAANYGNWQYLAGVGSDPRTTSGAATRPPVGRYFNVAKQAMLYDPDATFMRTWCPELRPLCETQAQRCGDDAAAAVACYVDRRLLTALLQEAGADASGRRIDYPAEPIAALAHGLDPVADLLTAKDDLVRRTKRRGVKHGNIPLLAQAS
eukprot:gene6898-4968_t